MSTQLLAILAILLLAIAILFLAMFTLSAAILSGQIAASERQAEILAAQRTDDADDAEMEPDNA